MIEPIFGIMTSFDVALIIFINQTIFVILFTAIWLTRAGYPKWIPRKIVHISIATALALVIPFISNLTGVLVTLILFLTWLSILTLAGLKFREDVLEAGRRENERPIHTFLSPFVVLFGFGVLLYLSQNRNEIFAAGVLTLGWGDGFGEIFGRLFGRHHYRHICKDKTIEGSLSVAIGTFLGILAPYSFYNPSVLSISFFTVITVIAIIIAIVETLCVGWMDNLFLPMLTGFLLLLFGF